jgi:hypothetical protein
MVSGKSISEYLSVEEIKSIYLMLCFHLWKVVEGTVRGAGTGYVLYSGT